MTTLPAPVEPDCPDFTRHGVTYEHQSEGWDEPQNIWRAHQQGNRTRDYRGRDNTIYGEGPTPEEADAELWKRLDADYYENLDYGSPRLPPSMRSGW